jgi:hypothetical protein
MMLTPQSRVEELPSNPWIGLPDTAPFIAAVDRGVMAQHPAAAGRLLLDHLPVPYMGLPSAEITLLTLNPGGRQVDTDYGTSFLERRRRSLTFEGDGPAFWLDPEGPHTEGYEYWTRRLRLLIEACGQEAVAKRILVAQYFPYQSLVWEPFPAVLPSQDFTFQIVRQAIRDKKLIVVLRSLKLWLRAVPELVGAERLHIKNPRSPYLTPANLGADGFGALLTRLS